MMVRLSVREASYDNYQVYFGVFLRGKILLSLKMAKKNHDAKDKPSFNRALVAGKS